MNIYKTIGVNVGEFVNVMVGAEPVCRGRMRGAPRRVSHCWPLYLRDHFTRPPSSLAKPLCQSSQIQPKHLYTLH